MLAKLGSLIAALMLMTACGGGEATTDPGAGGGEEDLSLTIESPADGDSVSVPFTLEFASSVPLGPTDTGQHHVHVYYDDNEDEYEVVESDTFEVTDLPAGTHEVYASLRNADHSDTGVEAEIELTVSGGGGDKSQDKGGGYDY
jgi:hypothetical protein